MTDIHKFIENIELRLQYMETTQEDTNKVLLDLKEQLNMLQTQVTNTHETFNLLIKNVNNKQKKVQIVKSSDSSSSDSDSSEDERLQKLKNKRQTKRQTKKKTAATSNVKQNKRLL